MFSEMFDRQANSGDSSNAIITYKKLARFTTPNPEQSFRYGTFLETTNKKEALETYETALSGFTAQKNNRKALVVLERIVAAILGRCMIRADADTLLSSAEREGRVKDFATQSTQLGPHRDDVAFELEGREAGSFASQGQLRAIMLAWKTAELAVLARAHGDSPILLLDDVSSELDAARNEYLFEHLATLAGQCFITTTHEAHVLLRRERADYRIENGQISS